MPDVRPFHLDPLVLDCIRAMEPEDSRAAARLHAAGMGHSLWADLGEEFLHTLYRGMMDAPGYIGFVYDDGKVRGLIAGAEDVPALYRWLLRHRGSRLLVRALAGLVRAPRVAAPLLQTTSYFRRSAGPGEAVPAESLFCAVDPLLRGAGPAGHLNRVFFDELAARGHGRVAVTTEADNDGAQRQLLAWGFAERGRFQFYGKPMLRLELDLDSSPRVEACRRHHRRRRD